MDNAGKNVTVTYMLPTDKFSRSQILDAVDAIAYVFVKHRHQVIRNRLIALKNEMEILAQTNPITTSQHTMNQILEDTAEMNALEVELVEAHKFLTNMDVHFRARRNGSFKPKSAPAPAPTPVTTQETPTQIPMRTGINMLTGAGGTKRTSDKPTAPRPEPGLVAPYGHEWIDIPLHSTRQKYHWYFFLNTLATSAQTGIGPDGQRRNMYWRKTGEYTEAGFVQWAVRKMQKEFREAVPGDSAPWIVTSPVEYKALKRRIEDGNFTTVQFMEWADLYMKIKGPHIRCLKSEK